MVKPVHNDAILAVLKNVLIVWKIGPNESVISVLAKIIIIKKTLKHSDRINGSKVIKHLRTIVISIAGSCLSLWGFAICEVLVEKFYISFFLLYSHNTKGEVHNHVEESIRPYIDLIDTLRSVGIHKDLALPTIAVIGDQSSGKSSVLEALSGIALPRGSGEESFYSPLLLDIQMYSNVFLIIR